MRLEKCRPWRSSAPLRRRFNAIALQDVGNRSTADFMVKIGQRSSNTRVSPTSIFLRPPYDQLREMMHDARPSHASSLGKVPLLRNQTSMPSQQGIRRDDGVELDQRLSSYSLGLARQQSPLSIGKTDAPSAQPVLEQSVLGLKEFDDDQLMTMNPASGDHQQKRKQRWHRAHAVILPTPRRSYFWTPLGRPGESGARTSVGLHTFDGVVDCPVRARQSRPALIKLN